ncbi:hypothetical protein FACS1894187_13150 [Synergistales bacterium]|nr:hypothetical protein FACS1894187_13150 [Synergistales bacterium]
MTSSKPSFYQVNVKIKFSTTHVHVEKIGRIMLSEHGRIPVEVKYSNPIVTHDGRHWQISVGVEYERKTEILSDVSLGIDLGVKELAVCSGGDRYENINKTDRMKRLEKRRVRYQRKVSKNLTKKGRKTNKPEETGAQTSECKP